jgi:hypothetical protein
MRFSPCTMNGAISAESRSISSLWRSIISSLSSYSATQSHSSLRGINWAYPQTSTYSRSRTGYLLAGDATPLNAARSLVRVPSSKSACNEPKSWQPERQH